MMNMIKIYKNTEANEKLTTINNIEPNTWINLTNPTKEEINYVAKNIEINASLLEEMLVEKDLPRIKKTKEATLIVVDLPYINAKNEYNTFSLGIILVNDLHLITISLKETELLNRFVNNEIPNFYTAKKSRFCIQILEEASKEYLKILTKFQQYLEIKEPKLLNLTNNNQLLGILKIEKSLLYFITSLKYNNTVLEKISKEYVIDIYKEDMIVLEDTIIDNKQCIEMCTIYREIVSSTTNTYGTIISNNLNVAMRFLAGITIVFSIPTMIASFLGMNVPLGFLAKSPFAFIIIVIISFIIAFCLAKWLKKKNLF